MKKEVMILALVLFFTASVLAEGCDLLATLLNQDPYPAVPGDYVKLVFQLSGLENPECGLVTFRLLEQYPISLDPNSNSEVTVNAGTYTKDHSSYLMIPYKVLVDKDAINGDSPVEVSFSYKGSSQGQESKQFDLNIQDTRAEFEVFVKNYDATTQELTLEILNIGDADIQALTVEIPKQKNIEVKGANKIIVGDLDSNEYSSVDIEGIPSNGEISINLIYTDAINVRREVNETVVFDSSYFENRVGQAKKTSIWVYILLIAIVVGGIVWWKKRKAKKKR